MLIANFNLIYTIYVGIPMIEPKETKVNDNVKEYRKLIRVLPNEIDALSSLAENVELFGEEAGWDFAVIMQVNLVLEELIVNVIHYGYPDGRTGAIDVLIETDTKEINIHIVDDGDAFDPFQKEAPDLSLSIDERPIGGLGIYLVRSYMHSYDYSYAQNHNKVRLTKQLSSIEKES
jgi:serine/threonine-protein kinase RsbW